MNINYKQIGPDDIDDLEALLKVYVDVFEMENFIIPDKLHLHSLISDNRIVFQVALANNMLIGGLSAYILPSIYSNICEVYIYDLAVKTTFQRRGIGCGLISSLKEYCVDKGYRSLFVQADIVDKHAINFYKATGGKEENVVHFTYQI
ncbi:GNAT family N-acetyltransferase [Chryseobacterium chendengshani]|uniref:GNAT family N-acetyltransferase n=1 Tax=Chryseobacterium sp. LJ668 TaxID=2864040 RepID=UPI001C68E75C|nr:GNAT family N-acetyltransferase [Chryseobacterium sp. LJ668]MBW8523854.1 GNAT family N-acetyltransferase [Chryseobacterium sp. LJ668]QYK16797.1 GNAT family N-acetyltransferase [Chryseobacterium sp. LJ668]